MPVVIHRAIYGSLERFIGIIIENFKGGEADYSESNMKEKIKKYKNFKDPYILVLGDREAAENTVSINMRGSNRQLNNIPIERFLAMCERMNEEHSLELLESAD